MPSELAKAEDALIHWRKVAQSWFHSRKALIFLVTFVIANVALFTHLLNGDQWITIIKWDVASYMAANVADGATSVFTKTSDQ